MTHPHTLSIIVPVYYSETSLDELHRRLYFRGNVEGWALLMIALLVVSGVQLTTRGAPGQYLWRTLDETRRRPIFAIDTIFVGKAASGTAAAEREG